MEKRIWFTSDTHFSHDSIRKYCNRPFVSVEEMDETLIINWNNVVKPNDTIIHCGDFAFKKPEYYQRRLNGNIILCLGNHDRREKLKGFNSIHQIYEFRIGEQHIVCCHYAMRVWNKSHYGAWEIFGHSHGNLPDDPNALSLDVGVDVWNFTPVSFEQIKEKILLKAWKPIEHHIKK